MNNEILKKLDFITNRIQRHLPDEPPSYETSVTVQQTSLSLLLTTQPSPSLTRRPKMRERSPVACITPIDAPSVSDLRIPHDITGRFCDPWCSCSCHRSTSLHLPQGWQHAFGALSISYKGLPGASAACSQSSCRRRATPSVKMSYRFPAALLQRKLMMSWTFSPRNGPESSTKLPRVVDWTSPVWQHATAGNVREMVGLFDKGLASPYDISPVGGNLLHVSVLHT